MRINGNLILKCKKCSNTFEYEKDNFDYDISINKNRGMGDELVHQFDGECECPNCQQIIKFSIIATEYPVGSFNSYLIDNIQGGILENEIDFDLEYDDLEYNEYDDLFSEYETAKMKVVVIRKFEDFTKLIDNNKQFDVFRGQINSNWDLVPSGYRENEKRLKLYSESDLIFFLKEFKSKVRANLNNENYSFNDVEWEIFAQHYGLPTKLLDVTFSPYTALLFAVEDAFDNRENDAVVWAFNSKEYNLEQNGNKDMINVSIDFDEFSNAIKPCFVKSAVINKRLLAQKGAFIYFDSRDIEKNKDLYKKAMKIIIPNENKKDILKSLFHFGINFYSLYPDIDSISKDLKMIKSIEGEDTDDGR